PWRLRRGRRRGRRGPGLVRPGNGAKRSGTLAQCGGVSRFQVTPVGLSDQGLLALGDAHPGAEALTKRGQELFGLLPLLADELAEDLSAIVLLVPAVGLNGLELGDQCLEQVVGAVV